MIRRTLMLLPIVSALSLSTLPSHAFFTKYGEASCRESAAGQCAQLSNKTLIHRESSVRVSYFSPDGTWYRLQSTDVTRTRWRVDESGQNLIMRTFGSGRTEQPISDFLARATEIIDGDPGGLSENRRGFYTLPLRDLPTNEILEQVRAR